MCASSGVCVDALLLRIVILYAIDTEILYADPQHIKFTIKLIFLSITDKFWVEKKIVRY